jgi:hypothetical protein
VFYKTKAGKVPAETFLDECPDSVDIRINAVLKAVSEAPPPRFRGMWEGAGISSANGIRNNIASTTQSQLDPWPCCERKGGTRYRTSDIPMRAAAVAIRIRSTVPPTGVMKGSLQKNS